VGGSLDSLGNLKGIPSCFTVNTAEDLDNKRAYCRAEKNAGFDPPENRAEIALGAPRGSSMEIRPAKVSIVSPGGILAPELGRQGKSPDEGSLGIA
jgi:hypothetical protein